MSNEGKYMCLIQYIELEIAVSCKYLNSVFKKSINSSCDIFLHLGINKLINFKALNEWKIFHKMIKCQYDYSRKKKPK